MRTSRLWLSVVYYVLNIVLVIMIICPTISFSQSEIYFPDDNYQIGEGDSSVTSCISPNNKKGKCISIGNCTRLLTIINNSTKRNLISRYHCGWEENDKPKVCCEHEEPPKVTNFNCTTPDNARGYCIPAKRCQQVLYMLAKRHFSQETIDKIINLRCGEDNFGVCCALDGEPRSLDISGGQCEMSSIPPDPSSGCCGRGREIGADRIVGGSIATIDQFPWTVLMEYNNTAKEIVCAGTLISGRYVLTAAHCTNEDSGRPVNVILGEYDTENSGADCIDFGGGIKDCTDGTVTIAIENIIQHPYYYGYMGVQINDIALIRLVDTAPYTAFIRPICLPTRDFTEKDTAKTQLTAAGWGAFNEIKKNSKVKRYVHLPVVRPEICFPLFLQWNAQLSDGHLCAGGLQGKDTCSGDSGGPLMLEHDDFTELVGITSFGFKHCGTTNRPGVYTKVYHYLKWINSIIS